MILNKINFITKYKISAKQLVNSGDAFTARLSASHCCSNTALIDKIYCIMPLKESSIILPSFRKKKYLVKIDIFVLKRCSRSNKNFKSPTHNLVCRYFIDYLDKYFGKREHPHVNYIVITAIFHNSKKANGLRCNLLLYNTFT